MDFDDSMKSTMGKNAALANPSSLAITRAQRVKRKGEIGHYSFSPFILSVFIYCKNEITRREPFLKLPLGWLLVMTVRVV
jgi:hypothetical protein